jgi:hypothetical protein
VLARFFALTGVCSLVLAQAPPTPPPPPMQRPFMNFEALPRPAVPTDPLELVTGPAQAVENVEQRAAAVALLTKARQLSNVRAQPYDLKTSFTSSGGLASDGAWSLEDVSPGRGIYRWSAQGPGYSATNLYTSTTQGMLYSNQPGGVVPMRLAQVREALFFQNLGAGPQMSLRTASGYLNGVQQQCVLTGMGMAFSGKALTGPRNWEEVEICADAATGLLTTYSPVPGLFVHYDYQNAVQFHGKTIAGAFTITEAGRPVIEARTQSLTDPPDAKNPMFDNTGLIPLGVGQEMTPAWRSRSRVPLFQMGGRGVQPPANLAIQVVVLHGTVGPDGKLVDTEVLASTDSNLNQTGIARASQFGTMMQGNRAQPGATAQSHEAIYTFEFVTGQ